MRHLGSIVFRAPPPVAGPAQHGRLDPLPGMREDDLDQVRYQEVSAFCQAQLCLLRASGRTFPIPGPASFSEHRGISMALLKGPMSFFAVDAGHM